MDELENILYDTTTKVLKDSCTKELINEAELGNFPSDLWNELEDIGMTKIGIPEDSGGSGFSYKEGFNILKIAGEFATPIPIAETFIGNWLLNENGFSIKDGPLSVIPFKYIEDIKFEKHDDHWQVSGSARFIPFGRNVEYIVLIGKTDQDYVLAVLNKNDVTITNVNNLAGEPRDEIHLDHLNIPLEDAKIVDQHVVYRLRDFMTLSRIALMAGGLKRILELTIQYANEREQFGRPIGKFQAIKQQIAVLASHVVSANTAADYAINALDQGEAITHDLALAKIIIGEAVGIATTIAHQVHAAIGFTHEHPLHHNTRRLWAWRDEGGNETYWSKFIGSYILNDYEDSLWSYITK